MPAVNRHEEQLRQRAARELRATHARLLSETEARLKRLDRDLGRSRDKHLPLDPRVLRESEAMRRTVKELKTSVKQAARDDIRTAEALRVAAVHRAEEVEARRAIERIPRASAARLDELARTGPLGSRLNVYGESYARKAEQHLRGGLLRGDSPSRVAKRMAETLGGRSTPSVGLEGYANLVANTEMARAFHAAQIDAWRANPDIIGWTWVANLGDRCCAMCWAMHGSVHAQDEPFATHPGCRCSPEPLRGEDPLRRKGAELFDELPAAAQLSILVPGKYGLYQSGQLSISETGSNSVVRSSLHPDWGPVRQQTALRNLT